MKGILKKLMKIGFAGALSLLAFAPSAVMAQEKSIDVQIPVSTEFTSESDTPADTVNITTKFTLEPLNGAPAPTVSEVSIDKAGKASLGPCTFTVPGNYYYELTAKGENNSEIDEKLIVRVTVVNDEEDGLSSVVTAYHSETDASGDKGKVDTKFLIEYKAPTAPTPTPTPRDPKTPNKVKTSVYAQPGLWIIAAGAALFIMIGLSKRSKAR